MSKPSCLTRCLIIAGLFGATAASAQIVYDTPGATYVQNFDVPTVAGFHHRSWTNNQDPVNPDQDGGSIGWTGWYAATGHASGNLSTGTGTSTSTSDVRISTGSTNLNYAVYLFRTDDTTDTALGSAVANTFAPTQEVDGVSYGMRLINNTGETLTQFTVTSTGEQWRVATNQTTAQSLTVSYQIGASDLVGGTWTNASDLTFTSPQVAPNTSTPAFSIDGNHPDNQTLLTQTITGVTWNPGTELWVRWFDVNDTGNDHPLSIDNVQFSAAIPEPATYALAGAALALGAAFLRRRLQP